MVRCHIAPFVAKISDGFIRVLLLVLGKWENKTSFSRKKLRTGIHLIETDTFVVLFGRRQEQQRLLSR
jgi:hypothetical protein